MHQMTSKWQTCHSVNDRNKEYCSPAEKGPFDTNIRVWLVVIIEDSTVTGKPTTRALFLYLNVYLRVELDSLSGSVTPISLSYSSRHDNIWPNVYICS